MISEKKKSVCPSNSHSGLADHVGMSIDGLLEALKDGNLEKLDAHLELLSQVFDNKSYLNVPMDSLLRTWAACQAVIEANQPETCVRALKIMCTLAQLWTTCSPPAFANWQLLNLPLVVSRTADCIKLHPHNVAVQAACCSLFSRLTGCATCSWCHNHDFVRTISPTILGAVMHVIQDLEDQIDADKGLISLCASEGLQALCHVTFADPAYLEDSAIVDSSEALYSALKLANSRLTGQRAGLMLLAGISCLENASAETIMTSLTAAVQCISAQIASHQPRSPLTCEVLQAALWNMAHVFRAGLRHSGLIEVHLESTVHQAAISLLSLLSQVPEEESDQKIAKLCLDVITVLAAGLPPGSLPPALASPTAALVVARLAVFQTEEFSTLAFSGALHVKSSAARTFWCLLTTGSIKFSGSRDAESELKALTTTAVRMARSHGCRNSDELCTSGYVVHAYAAALTLKNGDDDSVRFPALDHATVASIFARLHGEKAFRSREQSAVQVVATITETPLPSSHDLSSCFASWGECIALEALQRVVESTVLNMIADDPPSINAPHTDGMSLLHRLAATGQAAFITLVLSKAGSHLDLLARNKAGATALQLARQGRHAECVALLEDVTQVAAEARQEALLRELENSRASEHGADEIKDGRKGKKKKSVRSASFDAEQPGEKSQKVGDGEVDDAVMTTATAIAAEVAGIEEDTARRQLMDEEYELALESRRKELEEQRQLQLQCQDFPFSMGVHGTGGGCSPDGHPTTSVESTDKSEDSLVSSFAATEPARLSIFENSLYPDNVLNGVASRPGEHSLFGSPSLTGDMFSGKRPNSSFLLSDDPRIQDSLIFGTNTAPLHATSCAGLERGSSLFGGLEGGLPPGHGHSSSVGLFPQVVPQAPMGKESYTSAAQLPLECGMLYPAARAVSDAGSDESAEPTRHLWIGNLCTRTPRTLLKGVFERHGVVEDVVTFPGRMYAFVNFRTTEEAVAATCALQDHIVPDLTGDRPLLLKYRPEKKAAVHLRMAGLNEGLVGDDGAQGGDVDRDGNCLEPSPRIWLGNIAPTATSKSLHTVLGRFGQLTDAAVFPARIGPLGYAFVKFENLEDAMRAFDALNNTVVPLLCGSKQLKMRYKPTTDGPPGRDGCSEAAKGTSVPSRHLWLGNITQKPSEDFIYQIFSRYGIVDSVRIFPAKAYAFVNFIDVGSAVLAMNEMDGVPVPALTGVKPVVMRFQQEVVATAGRTASRSHSESNLSIVSLNQLVPGAGFGSMSGSGDSSSEDGVGVVPGVVRAGIPHQAFPANIQNKPHRSASMGLLDLGTTPFPPAANPDNHQRAASLLAVQRGQQASVLGGLPPFAPSMQPQTSTSQLSAVLNQLTALQRAASGGLHHPQPPCGGAGMMEPNSRLLQLNLLQQQGAMSGLGMQGAGMNSAAKDIARLSSMLAGQSLNTIPSDAAGNPSVGGGLGPGGVLCPLSGQIMVDPVIAADGFTYNRKSISEWMGINTVSPMTNAPLPHACLMPNPGVKAAVVDYLRAQFAGST